MTTIHRTNNLPVCRRTAAEWYWKHWNGFMSHILIIVIDRTKNRSFKMHTFMPQRKLTGAPSALFESVRSTAGLALLSVPATAKSAARQKTFMVAGYAYAIPKKFYWNRQQQKRNLVQMWWNNRKNSNLVATQRNRSRPKNPFQRIKVLFAVSTQIPSFVGSSLVWKSMVHVTYFMAKRGCLAGCTVGHMTKKTEHKWLMLR